MYPTENNYLDYSEDDVNAFKLPGVLIDVSKFYQKFRDQLLTDRGQSSIFINTEGMKLDIFLFMVGYGLADFTGAPLRREEYLEDLIIFLRERINTVYAFEEPLDNDILPWLEDDLNNDKKAGETFLTNQCMDILHKTFSYMYNVASQHYKKSDIMFLMPVRHFGSLINQPLNTNLIGTEYSVQVLCTIHSYEPSLYH